VEKRVVVELEAVEVLLPVHKAQLVTYLKLSGHRVGLLVSFNSALIRQGMQRIGIGVICETRSFPSRHGGRNLLRKPLEMCCRRTGFLPPWRDGNDRRLGWIPHSKSHQEQRIAL
jgi:hypothetical protein